VWFFQIKPSTGLLVMVHVLSSHGWDQSSGAFSGRGILQAHTAMPFR
jgi:hypothetical protein